MNNDLPCWESLVASLKTAVRVDAPAGGPAMITVRLYVKDRVLESFSRPTVQRWRDADSWRKVVSVDIRE